MTKKQKRSSRARMTMRNSRRRSSFVPRVEVPRMDALSLKGLSILAAALFGGHRGA